LKKTKINWSDFSTIATTVGIFISLFISIFFGIIQPKNEIKKNIVIICTNIDKEIEHNYKILDLGNESFESNFNYNDNNDKYNLLQFMYGELFLSISTEYWDNNSQYLALNSPQDRYLSS